MAEAVKGLTKKILKVVKDKATGEGIKETLMNKAFADEFAALVVEHCNETDKVTLDEVHAELVAEREKYNSEKPSEGETQEDFEQEHADLGVLIEELQDLEDYLKKNNTQEITKEGIAKFWLEEEA